MKRRSLIISHTRFIAFFLFLASCISFLIGKKPTFILMPLYLLIILDKNAKPIELLFGSALGSIFTLLVNFKVISYALFPQAAVLYNTNPDVFFWFSRGNEHAIRLLVAYPGILLSNWSRVDITGGMTIYSSSLLVLIMNFMLRILKYNEMENWLSAVISSIVTLILSFIMNGRMIFSFFGITLLMMCEVMYNRGRISLLMLQVSTYIAVLFTTVSSGTLTIITAYLVLITPYRWHLTKQKKEKICFVLINAISLYVALTIFIPYLSRMILRNINFFGGGFIGVFNMLQHGLGKVFYTENILLVYLLLFFGGVTIIANISFFVRNIVKKQNKDLPLLLMVNLCVYGFLFGRSTGLAMLIPVIVLFLKFLNNNVSVKL